MNAISAMASPASAQIQHGQTSADELALDWENAWCVSNGLCEDQVISSEVYEAVAQIDAELAAIKPSDSFWSDEALRHDSRWADFRLRAQAILNSLRILDLDKHQKRDLPHSDLPLI